MLGIAIHICLVPATWSTSGVKQKEAAQDAYSRGRRAGTDHVSCSRTSMHQGSSCCTLEALSW